MRARRPVSGMLDVTYTMSRRVEGLNYTEIYKTRIDVRGEVRRDETMVDGFVVFLTRAF